MRIEPKCARIEIKRGYSVSFRWIQLHITRTWPRCCTRERASIACVYTDRGDRCQCVPRPEIRMPFFRPIFFFNFKLNRRLFTVFCQIRFFLSFVWVLSFRFVHAVFGQRGTNNIFIFWIGKSNKKNEMHGMFRSHNLVGGGGGGGGGDVRWRRSILRAYVGLMAFYLL